VVVVILTSAHSRCVDRVIPHDRPSEVLPEKPCFPLKFCRDYVPKLSTDKE
jgi:hypothetical protein